MRLSLLVSVLAFPLSLSVAGVAFAGSLLGDGDGDTIDSLFDNCRDRLGVDQVVRHERLDVLTETHPLLDGPLHANQTDPILVLE